MHNHCDAVQPATRFGAKNETTPAVVIEIGLGFRGFVCQSLQPREAECSLPRARRPRERPQCAGRKIGQLASARSPQPAAGLAATDCRLQRRRHVISTAASTPASWLAETTSVYFWHCSGQLKHRRRQENSCDSPTSKNTFRQVTGYPSDCTVSSHNLLFALKRFIRSEHESPLDSAEPADSWDDMCRRRTITGRRRTICSTRRPAMIGLFVEQLLSGAAVVASFEIGSVVAS